MTLPGRFKTGTHHVLCKISTLDEREFPYPNTFQDSWDTDHVRLPCSSRSSSRWQKIVQGLTAPITNPQELFKTLRTWNEGSDESYRTFTNALEAFLNQKSSRPKASRQKPTKRSNSMDMDMDVDEGLNADDFMSDEDLDRNDGQFDEDILETDFLSKDEKDNFFNILLPKIQSLALRLPELVKKPIPLLKQQEDSAITLSQEQIACLLANAFFCTFPSRNSAGPRRQRTYSDRNPKKRLLESRDSRHGSKGINISEKPKDPFGVAAALNRPKKNPLQNSSGQTSLFAYFGRVDPKPGASGVSIKQQRTESTTRPVGRQDDTRPSGYYIAKEKERELEEEEEDPFPYFPTINFWTLFGSKDIQGPCAPANAAKLRCILHYFERVTSSMPQGAVTFHRQVMKGRVTLEKSERISDEPYCYTKVQVDNDSPLEDEAPAGALQLDFANKVIGGGILGHGSVQEEIRFAICPELIISRLFTQQLRDNEALLMKGAERFSNYNGYARTFTWHSNHVDQTPRDMLGRRKTEICAIDALPFKSRDFRLLQFSRKNILREINKAIVGFRVSPITSSEWGMCRAENPLACPPPIATGNWGCGAFGGHLQLKFLIQILAASVCGGYSDEDVEIPLGRDVIYYTYGIDQFSQEVKDFVPDLLGSPQSVDPSLMLECLCQYPVRSTRGEIVGLPRKSLFDYIRTALGLETPSDGGYSYETISTFASTATLSLDEDEES